MWSQNTNIPRECRQIDSSNYVDSSNLRRRNDFRIAYMDTIYVLGLCT